MEQKIFEIILKEDDTSWRDILLELVKSEGMDPWDVNITHLTQKYLQVVKEMQKHDLKVSGKVLLAAAMLLRFKSTHFIDHDISNLDKLFNQTEELMEEDVELSDLSSEEKKARQKYQLIPRNPQPRSRKVSINDLIEALQHAMESKKRILAKMRPVKYDMPKRKMDIMEVIRDLYYKILYYTDKDQKEELTFTRLLPPRAGKTEKVYTFIPLLHLESQRQIDTRQEKAFDEIHIKLLKKTAKE